MGYFYYLKNSIVEVDYYEGRLGFFFPNAFIFT
jgi:hypothetical protein